MQIRMNFQMQYVDSLVTWAYPMCGICNGSLTYTNKKCRLKKIIYCTDLVDRVGRYLCQVDPQKNSRKCHPIAGTVVQGANHRPGVLIIHC